MTARGLSSSFRFGAGVTRSMCLVALLALVIPPQRLAAQVAEADAAWNQGRYGAARDAYLRALTQDPTSVRAAYRLGVLAAWDGNLDSALTLLAQARAADPADPDVRATQAQVLTWAGRYPQALVQWDSLIALYPDRLDGLTGKAKTLAWSGRLTEADSLYSVVLRRDPTNADALDGRAQAAFWQGRNAEAIAGYERALSYRPDDITARTGLAQVYRASGRQLDALAEADSAVTIARTNRDALRARQDIARTELGAVDVSLGWNDDSDHNMMWWQVVGVASPLSNRVRGFASVGAYEGSSEPAIHATRGTVEFGATFLQARWQLTVAGGAQGLWPGAGVSRTVPTGRLAAGYRIRPSLGIGVGYSHFPYAETAYLIGADLDVDAVDGSLEATLSPGLSLSAGGGAGWFSDGNVRTSAVLGVTKQLPLHFFVGGMGRMVWYQEPGVGYFSPDRLTVVEGRGGYARTGPTWETRLSAGAGVQQIGFGGGWQFEGHLEGRAAYWFADRNRIEAFAGVSNSAYLSATGAYRWGTAGLVLRIGI
jgi:tetratricopeptide (TPR) repeat protein